MKVAAMTVGALGVNCYIYFCSETKEAAVIDPGGSAAAILRRLDELQVRVKYIINTHGHSDHIGANTALVKALRAPLLIHEDDAAMLTDARKNLSAYMGEEILSVPADRMLKDGDTIAIGGGLLTVLHTPGHTPGGVCLLEKTLVFSGDTLFEGSVGRSDFPGGSHEVLIDSVRRKLMTLPDEVQVYPGHGPETSIGRERRINPFL